MTKLKIIFTLLLITLAVSTIAAQNPPPPNGFGENDKPQNRNQFIAQKLGLTQEQRIQWRKINKQVRFERQKARRQLNQARKELDQIIYADNVDETELNTKIRSVIEAQAAITKIQIRSELSVRNLLSPEQLVKFRNIRKQIKKQQKQRQLQQQRRQRRRRLNNNKRNPNRQNRPPQGNNRRPL